MATRKPIMKKVISVTAALLGMLLICCACGTPDNGGHEGPSPSGGDEAQDPDFEDVTTYRVTDMQGEEGLDFIIDFPAGKDVTVLQITDTQMQTMAGVRNQRRANQVRNAFFKDLPDDFDFRVWRYMDEAVAETQPSLIVLTGDNIYGELDDSGEMWLALVEKMDSYQIPWCVVFGNHDNESAKGVRWQIEQLMNSEYCIFRQGNVAGNCNYNLLIRQGGKAKYLLYMLDSNGCKVIPNNPGEGMLADNVDIALIQQKQGFRDNQISWMYNSAKGIREAYGEVPTLMFYHIPTSDVTDLVKEKYGDAVGDSPFEPDQEGDFGHAYEITQGASCSTFLYYAKKVGCVGMFVGHQHKIATSIMCDGVRLTYGLKTGTYDYHSQDMLGSTLITLPVDGSDFEVEYIYSKLTYEYQN